MIIPFVPFWMHAIFKVFYHHCLMDIYLVQNVNCSLYQLIFLAWNLQPQHYLLVVLPPRAESSVVKAVKGSKEYSEASHLSWLQISGQDRSHEGN